MNRFYIWAVSFTCFGLSGAQEDHSVINDERRIVVLVCSYNNKPWYRWNLDAIRKQRYSNYHVLYIDDCSPDGTGQLVQEYIDEHQWHDKVTLVRNTVRRGPMANQYHAVHDYCDDMDIVVICDGDDRFAHADVLSFVNKVYADGSVWLTYGQFKVYPSGARGFCCPMPEAVVKNNAFRRFVHIPSHLRTFYAGLFKQIKLEDLMYDGAFLKMDADIAAMFPMIEMARDHFRFIPNVLLEYNDANVLNEHKISRELQIKLDKHIRSLAPYDRAVSPRVPKK